VPAYKTDLGPILVKMRLYYHFTVNHHMTEYYLKKLDLTTPRDHASKVLRKTVRSTSSFKTDYVYNKTFSG